jgi:hypothetical protein
MRFSLTSSNYHLSSAYKFHYNIQNSYVIIYLSESCFHTNQEKRLMYCLALNIIILVFYLLSKIITNSECLWHEQTRN